MNTCEEIDLLYRLSVLSLLSIFRPWNTNEALSLIDAIDEDTSYEKLRTAVYAYIAEKTYDETNETFSYCIARHIGLKAISTTAQPEGRIPSPRMFNW